METAATTTTSAAAAAAMAAATTANIRCMHLTRFVEQVDKEKFTFAHANIDTKRAKRVWAVYTHTYCTIVVMCAPSYIIEHVWTWTCLAWTNAKMCTTLARICMRVCAGVRWSDLNKKLSSAQVKHCSVYVLLGSDVWQSEWSEQVEWDSGANERTNERAKERAA